MEGKRVVVMGLGRFGGCIGAARWLARSGARVIVTDRASASDLAQSIEQLSDLAITYHLGKHEFSDLDGCDLLVVSPAVNKDKSEFVQEAIRRGIPLSSEMNLFLERCPSRRIVGVTGSAGKSTTTAMIGEILSEAVRDGQFPNAWMGGNIGRSLLMDLERMAPEDAVVLELSSFQLEDIGRLRWSPPLALITNITCNHLDRHGTMEAYTDSKLNIVRFQSNTGQVFVHADDAELLATVCRAGAGERLIRYSFDAAYEGDLNVPGRHNRANAAGAVAVARSLRISDTCIHQGLSHFAGLPHRLEFVGDRHGIRYFNDSKSTTPDSTRIALEAFDQPVIMLVGGGDKGMSFAELARQLAARAKAVVCYGETGDKLFNEITRYADGQGTGTRLERAIGFEDAIRRAHGHAEPGDVVVLSPACTSYDMFANYEQRGDRFRELVRGL